MYFNGCKQILIISSIKNIFFSVLLLLLGNSESFGQSYYSIDPNYISSRAESQLPNVKFNNCYPDTSIEQINNFIPRNFLGNLSLSSPDYKLNFKSKDLGFNLFDVPLNDYKIKKKDISYYHTKGPFAEFTGIAGSKQLQLFRMIFSNTFKNKLNVTLRLNRYTSLGYYKKQQSFTNNFYTSTNYTTSNQRFGFNAYVLINNNRFQENGGIYYDTLSQKELLTPKNLIPIKLNEASRDNRETDFKYSNWFRLNKNSGNRLQSYLIFHSAYSIHKYKYKEKNIGLDNFYFLTYLDTVNTNDSTRIRTYANGIDLLLESKNKNFTIQTSYQNEYTQYWQKSDTSFINHRISGTLQLNKIFYSNDSSNYKQFKNNLSADYIIAGAFVGNIKLETNHTFNFLRNNSIKESIQLKLATEDRTPDYIFKHWYSNHFIWDNTFNNTQTTQAELLLKTQLFEIGGNYKALSNYIYFDQLGYPKQNATIISNSALHLKFEKLFFKHAGISVKQSFQNSSSNLISLPKSISTASIYYRGNLFKNNLQLCVGGLVDYYDQFTPYAYMPATQTFYIQEDFKAGNFTFVDVFLNARIRPVSFFFKVENVLHGLLGTNYSMVPGYYQPERALRFGLIWQFYD